MNKNPLFFLIGGIFALMIAMGIGRFAYTPILPLMQQSLGFSDRFAGYLASSNYAGYFVGAIVIGLLPVQNQRTHYLRWSILLSIITTFLMGLTDTYSLMFVYRFISGVMSAFIFVLASSIVLDRLAQTGKTSWAGYFYSGVGFGILFSSFLIPSLNEAFGWQGTWIGLALKSTLLAIFVSLWLVEPKETIQKVNVRAVKSLKTPPRKWLIWLIIAYGLEGFGYIITGTFIVSLAEQTAVFTFDSSVVWLVVGIGAIPSCIIWAKLASQFGYILILIAAMILQAIGIVLPVFWLSELSLMISAFLFGATFMGITTLATTLARAIVPTNSSRLLGILTAVYAAGQMVGPSVAGILIDSTGSYYAALFGAAVVVMIGALLLVGGIRYDYIVK